MHPDTTQVDNIETPPPQDGRVLLDAALLKRLRKARGLSQEALADLCFQRQLCVSIASIKRAETGKIVLYRTARHLAQVFNVALDQMMAGAGPAAPADPGATDDVPPAALPARIAAALAANALDHTFPVASPSTGAAVHAAWPDDGVAQVRPAAAVADDVVRYVVMLHVELATPPRPDSLAVRDIAGVVQQFGGRMVALRDRQLSAVFGLPQAYRSDAERCMRCAIELNRHLLTHGGRAMALRLARWEYGAAEGRAPDLRLPGAGGRQAQPQAQAHTVLPFRLPLYVARNLLPLLDQRFLFEECPAGHARELAGYLAFSKPAASDASRLPPLIGRYAETRQFKAVAESVVESQCGHVVYLRAMAGVGKSRLAQEFADIARQQGMRCHRAEVQDAGAEHGWRAPLEQLARSLLGLGAPTASPGPQAPANSQAIAEMVARLYLPADTALFYHVLTGVRLSGEQEALYSAMSHEVREQGWAQALRVLVLRLAMTEPQLIALEDVHWGDPYLFEALGPLLALSREAPVLWVVTSRVENDPLETALRQQMDDLGLTVFDLAPMAAREAAALADQFGDVDPAYRRRCVERAQGNPLFLTQLLASPGQHLPDSLKHLIQARLDGLPPAQTRALRMAAVLGARFQLDLLRDALGQPDYAPRDGRDSLLRPAGGGEYGFVHDLVMHCIYDTIDPSQLRQLHKVAAEAWRTRDAAQCAHHLYRANDAGALDMMLAAIRGRLERHQFEAALDLTAACNAADSTSFSSFPLALLRAHASAGMGHMGNARQYYRHAMMLAGRPADRIEAVIGLAGALNILEELEEEERLLDETVPLALEIGAEAALGKLLYLKGNIYFPRGNYAECRRYHEDAARYAQASDTSETQARALSGVGDSYYAQGRMRKAHELFGQCLAMCERHRYVHIEASNRAALGSTRIYLGDAAGAARDALASAAIARQVGNQRAETFARMTAGWALVADGRLDQASQEVEHGLDLARALGSSRFETFLMESQARVTWLRGDHARAERQILATAQQMERLRLQNFIGPWVLGTLALFTRDPATRKRALLQGAAHLTRDCLAHNGYRFHLSAAEVSLLDGDTVAAEFYADQLAAYAAQESCAWIAHHTELIRVYAQWLRAPGDAPRARLRALHRQSADYGYTQAAPRLHLALQSM
ncbi:AAA family ATPase [Pseudoduganella namucuonensis]|uniref:Helix-turn-helix domain-containing protein n=1 Tax=Pseudoduganella namucuonensis TaxID=1035707 RepID=A0A1I7KBQ6_9BURK|nr:tetratricopeptide repeat protein [Pseudoduganella namucuonensis]SFU94800.1 Helix-turn-helix domain-containing protein [Pseudoduganella namucuonensis]